MNKQDRKNQLTPEEQLQLSEAIIKELKTRPPTIGLIGVSGVGKSSTINKMFKTNLKTSDTVACTKAFETIDLEMKMVSGEAAGNVTRLCVIDAPGLGEDSELDPEYLQMYRGSLPACDVILWIQAARNRAIAQDQRYLRELADFHGKIVFGLNQCDLVEPLDWNERINMPSEKQEENIKCIVDDRNKKMGKVLGKAISFVPFSSKTGWGLQDLFTMLLQNLPKERAWIYTGLKNFRFEDFFPAGALQAIKQGASNDKKNKSFSLNSFFNSTGKK